MTMSTCPIRRRASPLGQVSLEFTLFVIITFVFFGAFLYAVGGQLGELSSQRDAKELHDLTSRVREEVFLASMVRDGYTREFTLPEKLNGEAYTLEIADDSIIGTLGDLKYALPAPGVTGTIAPGPNNITKSGGTINLN